MKKLVKKAVPGIMLTLILLGMLTLAFGIQPVKASGTIYIRPDGSVEGTDKIQRDGDIYTFIGDIYNNRIIVQRDNIVIDGAGYTIQSIEAGYGIFLERISGVTIKNVIFRGFAPDILFNYSSNNIIYHNSFMDLTAVMNYDSLNIFDDGYPSGGNYWRNYVDVDLYCGPNQDFPCSDGIWDHPYVIDENNRDNYPLKKPYSPGNLSVSVSIDKYMYHAGDKMYVVLNVENPDSVKYLCFGMWVTLPDSSIYLYMHEHSVILPIGLSYTSSPFAFFILPNLPAGTYTWHAAFLVRETHTIIVEDTAEWEFV